MARKLAWCTFLLAFAPGPARAADDDAVEVAKLPPAAKEKVDFVRDIKPILSTRCYSCHGPEEEEGGLRLHQLALAGKGGNNGPAWIKGDSGKSRLVHFVAGAVEDMLMPPEGEGTPLTPAQVGVIRAWIDQGAVWPKSADVGETSLRGSDHWSFQPLELPALPKVAKPDLARNGIDAFVLAKLDADGIGPAQQADRATLIRRLYLDLLGLLPEPAEVDSFVADKDPKAYEKLVDRLLESSHFGERWARHWLDLARYADSDGYEKDRPRPFAWRYRNWVIDAINRDLPYDQFTIAQIAGDMLPNTKLADKVAVGFHRNTLHNTEGGTDKEEDRVKKTVDRTNTVGTVWLGLTVGCAQCHSHKYDPISQRDYYQLYAFFNSMNEVDIAAPLSAESTAHEKARAAFDKQHAPYRQRMADYEAKELAKAQLAWEQSWGASPPVWSVLAAEKMTSRHGAKLAGQPDGSVLVSGKNEASDVYTIVAETKLTKITGLRLEVLPDKSLVKNGPGRADNGNFVLAAVKLTVAPLSGKAQPIEVKFHRAEADFAQQQWPATAAITPEADNGWAISPEFGKRHVAVFETAGDVGIAGGSRLSITLDQTYEGKPHNLGRFRLAVTDAARPVHADGVPDAIRNILAVAREKRDKKQQDALAKYYRTVDPKLAALVKAEAVHATKAPKPPATKAQSVAELAARRPTHIHVRGDFLRKGAPVEPLTLPVLPPLTKANDKPDRLELARWLVSKENPLTARVTVNRVWQRYFGRGLVPTLDDFGTQGERPSHPQLLDWLAATLRDGGWKMKDLHRLIVTSATYRQSSAVRPELFESDPYNAKLARQTRRRVESEVVRDLALTASGLLSRRIGGPSVRPPQPAEYSKLTYANSARWTTSGGEDRYRRGLYTFFQRTSPYPMLVTFDAPDSNVSCTRRSQSNTPLQALTLWNDPAFVECAQALGRRIVDDVAASDDAVATRRRRAAYAFQLCLGRQPANDELDELVALVDDQTALAEADAKAAAAIAGSRPVPAGLSTPELAGWIALGRTLLNLDEFITRE